ncbi:glycosyltransferase family 25-domain-containing protein [Tirmania nivea]|nr:glycosyltransferase family 25-domain-containing protein [Tirmania nivea]
MMANLRGKPAVIIILTALLYLPAIYVLLDRFYSGEAVSDGNVIKPESNGREKTANTGHEEEKPAIVRNDGIQNSTLGFQKIFFVSLPERTDRQDTMRLIASYMGLDFTYVPGVNGSTIADKALPYDINNPPPKPPTPAELGCWRAHANVWARIIDENLSSALILEDDIDFTVGIRNVLTSISTHLQTFTGATHGEVYGLVDDNSWDMLHLGHCYSARPPSDTHPVSSKIFAAWEDEYAPEWNDHKSVLPNAKSSRIRALHPTFKVACTQAYVVSLAGARRLLYEVGGPGGELHRPIDLVIMNKFSDGALKGYTVEPSMFGQWKNGNIGDSDIPKEQEWKIEKGSGKEVIKGVMEEMKKTWGGRDHWKEVESKGLTKKEHARERRSILEVW